MNQSFKLICTACDYERAVSGLDPALDLGEAHKQREGENHSVDIFSFSHLASLTDREPLPGPFRPPSPETTKPTSADDGLVDTDD